ncbi:MAG TPA: hypothetical protein PK286_00325 [Devosia sp.]|nr:hypothetical protein [Devosia sp.]
MRKYQMSPALAATIHAVRTAPFREVQVPLHLELPDPALWRMPAYADDAEDLRIEAGGFTIGDEAEEDDDFY